MGCWRLSGAANWRTASRWARPDALGAGRLEREGSPLMQGAAGAVRILLGQEAPGAFGERLGSWVDAAAAPDAMAALAGRLRGAVGGHATCLVSRMGRGRW
jgi:hypothetical protein